MGWKHDYLKAKWTRVTRRIDDRLKSSMHIFIVPIQGIGGSVTSTCEYLDLVLTFFDVS